MKLEATHTIRSHQVDGVSLPGGLFHSALALIHRADGTANFVLKDTGQMVGEELAGVVRLWQEVLGCNEKGYKELEH